MTLTRREFARYPSTKMCHIVWAANIVILVGRSIALSEEVLERRDSRGVLSSTNQLISTSQDGQSPGVRQRPGSF